MVTQRRWLEFGNVATRFWVSGVGGGGAGRVGGAGRAQRGDSFPDGDSSGDEIGQNEKQDSNPNAQALLRRTLRGIPMSKQVRRLDVVCLSQCTVRRFASIRPKAHVGIRAENANRIPLRCGDIVCSRIRWRKYVLRLKRIRFARWFTDYKSRIRVAFPMSHARRSALLKSDRHTDTFAHIAQGDQKCNGA